MNKELIEKLKNNYAQLECLSEEEQKVFQKVGAGNCEYLDNLGMWKKSDLFIKGRRWRIRLDYTPEPEYKDKDFEEWWMFLRIEDRVFSKPREIAEASWKASRIKTLEEYNDICERAIIANKTGIRDCDISDIQFEIKEELERARNG